MFKIQKEQIHVLHFILCKMSPSLFPLSPLVIQKGISFNFNFYFISFFSLKRVNLFLLSQPCVANSYYRNCSLANILHFKRCFMFLKLNQALHFSWMQCKTTLVLHEKHVPPHNTSPIEELFLNTVEFIDQRNSKCGVVFVERP